MSAIASLLPSTSPIPPNIIIFTQYSMGLAREMVVAPLLFLKLGNVVTVNSLLMGEVGVVEEDGT